MYFFVASHLQIMNPNILIGFLLVVFYATNHVYAVPIASDASDLATTAENGTNVQNNDEKLDNLPYNNAVDVKSSENVSADETTIDQTTQKASSSTQKPKSNGRKRVRKSQSRRRPRKQPDCRQATTVKPVTPKPSPVSYQIPNFFISTGWGPGR